MSKGRQVSVEIHREITNLAFEGYGPAQIHRKLFPYGPESPGYISEKTVQRMVRDFRGSGSSEPWSFLTADADEAALVIDVVAWGVAVTWGRYRPFKEEATWIARVRTAVPDIPVDWALYVAGGYWLLSKQSSPDSRALDHTLGIRPWESDDLAHQWAMSLHECGFLKDTDPRVLDLLEFRSKFDLRADMSNNVDNQIDTLADGRQSAVVDE
jgi:hypothetical protein